MYYYGKERGNIKNIVLVILFILCVFCCWKSCNTKDNYSQERKDLNAQIQNLEKKYDSLEKESGILKEENLIYQDSYRRDSILIDSLNDQYNVQLDKTVRTENKAKSYLDRYNQLTKGVNKLENNKNYKTGDNLLNSLGDKLK